MSPILLAKLDTPNVEPPPVLFIVPVRPDRQPSFVSILAWFVFCFILLKIVVENESPVRSIVFETLLNVFCIFSRVLDRKDFLVPGGGEAYPNEP